MKKIPCLQIIGSGLLFMSATAAALNPPFPTGAPPTQVYHSVSEGSSDNKSSTTLTPTSAVTATPSLDATSGAAMINTSGGDVGLQTEVAQLSQTNTVLQQQTDQRIQNLNDSNRAIASAIQTINQNVSVLQQQVATLAQSESTSPNDKSTSEIKNKMDYLGMGGGAVMMLGFGVVLGRYARRNTADKPRSMHQKRPSSVMSDEKNSDDYDFMGTLEAIPAKLDLARSYIAMKEYEQARHVLTAVLEKGNEAQRTVALTLINKITSELS